MDTVTESNNNIIRSEYASLAVLFIHGILGSPKHFDALLPLVPESLSVCNMVLKGHGGTVKEFSAASMSEWKKQASKAFQALADAHEKVLIAAHSMGTLFAIREAIERPDSVAALFLLNPPLKVHIGAKILKISQNIIYDKVDENSDEITVAAKSVYGINETDKNILHYAGWLPRFSELLTEIRKTRKIINKLTVPTVAYFSDRDEVVSLKSIDYIAGNPAVTVKRLAESGHFCYSKQDTELLRADFSKMISDAERSN